jgi:hypothetical protein
MLQPAVQCACPSSVLTIAGRIFHEFPSFPAGIQPDGMEMSALPKRPHSIRT